MYKLIIRKSKAKNFNKALGCALELGGVFDGEKITLEVEKLQAYDKLFPLFKFNVLSWKGTKAYCNNIEVDPYRFLFLEKLKNDSYTSGLFNYLEKEVKPQPLIYYKRERSTFYFKNDYQSFEKTFTGKELFEFVDQYDIGDEVVFT